MWKQPWGYTEGWVICIGLFITGVVLQLTTGKVDATLFQYPLNALAGGVYLFLLIMIYAVSRKAVALQWFYSLTASITSLTAWMVLVIIMGLTRQMAPSATVTHGGLLSGLGFMQMTVSWPFMLLFLYFLSVLGLVTIRKISRFCWKDTPFILNHAGLFITLLAAILGNGDLQRLRMTASLDGPEWRAIDETGEMVELPLAIELKSFTIDEYPPKLLAIDNTTGKALPENTPENVLVENAPLSGSLLDWDIEVTHSLPLAACVRSIDTLNFVAFHSEGATTALMVKARNRIDGTENSGWVSCGSFMFPYVSLPLSDSVSLVMPEREPKRFASEVTVYTKSGEQTDALIEVNKPLSMEGWKIYQLSYDETKGKWSRISIFELVRDPWLPVVYIGILMMLLGSVCLFVLAPGNKQGKTAANDTKTV
ncbi:cytochrome c biogenesis protein ResB [uncultured Parabacteroides sp.]|jgi:hypothetical protein|uniref:cytochrome c biogenesis protein ResB n=1 Tax=uncultured Parabacteroides sp. TaxID=512312 RepID=UPI0025F35DA2|nr:cytochrome c biogenesis protein ResB [uncultured Parabacteroides sp.]